MGLFSRKHDEDLEDDFIEDEDEPRKIRRQFRDLNPENKKTRKEPLKPWGKKERIIVLIVLLVTVFTSGILALSARNFKLPKFSKIEMPNLLELNPFREKVIVVGNKGSKVSSKKIENAKKIFKEATNDLSGIYAFYIYDINGDYYYGLNYQEVMQAASLIKLPIMITAYKKIESGDLDRNKYTPYLEAMGKKSDYDSMKIVDDAIGRENINKAILDLGMARTSFIDNLTTPEEIGILLKKIYKEELIDSKDTKELEGFLTDTIYEDWLRPGIPQDIILVHKYGREARAVNDAGIILAKNPFIMVIMTDGVIESEADNLIPKLAKLLYDNHIKNENSN